MDFNICPEDNSGKAKAPDVKVFSASWDKGMWILNSILVLLLGGITITLLIAGISRILYRRSQLLGYSL